MENEPGGAKRRGVSHSLRAAEVNCALIRNGSQTIDGKGIDALCTSPLWYAEFLLERYGVNTAWPKRTWAR
ncbi:MAG: hypothetical protein J0I71_17165, partial [Rhodanobacter sp.]|nr:hypothetical protein [Rhodanobacter sp.]